MDSFTIKALSSFPREEIRGRRRERWNSIFQSVVFVNSDGEAASVRRVALFGHFRHFGIETDQLSLSLSLSLSLPYFSFLFSFIPFPSTPFPSYYLLFSTSPPSFYIIPTLSLSCIFVFIDKRNSFALLS